MIEPLWTVPKCASICKNYVKASDARDVGGFLWLILNAVGVALRCITTYPSTPIFGPIGHKLHTKISACNLTYRITQTSFQPANWPIRQEITTSTTFTQMNGCIKLDTPIYIRYQFFGLITYPRKGSYWKFWNLSIIFVMHYTSTLPQSPRSIYGVT